MESFGKDVQSTNKTLCAQGEKVGTRVFLHCLRGGRLDLGDVIF